MQKINLYNNNIDLYNILIKNKFFDKNGALEEELNKNKYIVHETIYTVIDTVLQNITNDYNKRQELKSFLISNYFSSFR